MRSPSALDMPSALSKGSVVSLLANLHAEFSADHEGEVATYIPELSRADPNHFGIVIATTDGRVHAVGDWDVPFTIQSVSKAFMYGDALKRLGRDAVLAKVGVEPTGDAFNSIVLDEKANRPFNPMVNAGAIAVSGLVEGRDRAEYENAMLAALSAFAGRALSIDRAVFESEAATGHRNRAIAYLMRNTGMIQRSPDDVLDTYFKQCSALVTCRDLAIMGATLANDGVNPLTAARVLPAACVRDVLSVMYGCGMYDYAGQWSFDVGLPAKSGVAGGLVAVAPGQFAIAFYSPRLDRFGNTVRGVKACKRISESLSLHAFCGRAQIDSVIRRERTGLTVRSNRLRRREDRLRLDADASPPRIVELQGALHFATTERVAHRLSVLGETNARVILDLRRVTFCDAASAEFLADVQRAWSDSGRTLAWTFVPPTGPLGDLNAALTDAHARVFADMDHALEHFEELTLGDAPIQSAASIDMLRGFDLFRGFDDKEWAEFVASANPTVVAFDAGATILRAGDPADRFFVVLAGAVRVTPDGKPDARNFRLASIGPGLTFGEMALFNDGRRSADVAAERRTVCVVITKQAFARLEAAHPAIVAKMYANLIREQAERLQRANVTINALES